MKHTHALTRDRLVSCATPAEVSHTRPKRLRAARGQMALSGALAACILIPGVEMSVAHAQEPTSQPDVAPVADPAPVVVPAPAPVPVVAPVVAPAPVMAPAPAPVMAPAPVAEAPAPEAEEGKDEGCEQSCGPKIKPYGMLQVWMVAFDQNTPAQNDPVVQGDPNLDEGFAVRRARLGIEGSLTPSTSYHLQLGYQAPFTGSSEAALYPAIEEAWVNFQRGSLPALRVGVDKVPFGGQQLSTSRRLLLIERAVSSEALTFSRDVGLLFHGGMGGNAEGSGLKGLEYYVGFYNGSGSYFGDNNGVGDIAGAPLEFTNPLGLLQVARVQVAFGNAPAPAGETNLGRSSFAETTVVLGANAAGNRKQESQEVAYGADLSLYSGPLSINLEVLAKTVAPLYTNEGIPDTLADIAGLGYFVQAGYFVVPDRVQLAARFESFNGNTNVVDADDLQLYTVGLNYFPTRRDDLKVQANYVRRVESSPTLQLDNDTFYLNFATFF
ncbi:MAG: porin [Myxococcota bacterium]